MPTETTPKTIYPEITIDRIKKPNRFYAFFLLGFVYKLIILIPVGIFLAILGIINALLIFVNAFAVLFTGKYWKPCYEFTLGIIRLSTRANFFIFGLTDRYPGFSFDIKEFSVDVAMPTTPNRLFAFPILGGLARIILLIPFLIYTSVIQYAGYIGMVFASFPVLFTGNYPESFYEIVRDSVRVNVAITVYMSGLSDKYPSFWISMNHKPIKIILIILATLYMLSNFARSGQTYQNKNTQQYQYNQSSGTTNTNPYNY